MQSLSATELHTRQQQTKALCLLDVREDDEWAEGHLAGAQHIPLGHLAEHLSSLDKHQPTVCYCRVGGRSARACALLLQAGFTEVYNLQGGIEAWQHAALPLQ